MKIIQKNWYLFVLLSFCFTQEVLPLTQRYFHTEDMGYEYQRGTYLIVLADPSLKTILTEEETGDFIKFKQSQGYNVKVIDFDWAGGTKSLLKYYLKNYYLYSLYYFYNHCYYLNIRLLQNLKQSDNDYLLFHVSYFLILLEHI